MKGRTKEERQAVARRIFEALCEHYPDRYIALVVQLGNAGLTATATQSGSEIVDLGVTRETTWLTQTRYGGMADRS